MEINVDLIGGGGHAKVIIEILLESKNSINGFWDDNKSADFLSGYKCLGTVNDFCATQRQKFIIAIGNNRVRQKLARILAPTTSVAIHPDSSVSERAKLGVGTVIMRSVSINPDVLIGEHVIVNTAAIVDHDCIVSDFVHLSPNVSLAGGVEIGEGTHVGIGSTIIQNIKIGKWATIGAGTVIIRDIPDFAVVVGNPGRIIKYNYPDEQ